MRLAKSTRKTCSRWSLGVSRVGKPQSGVRTNPAVWLSKEGNRRSNMWPSMAKRCVGPWGTRPLANRACMCFRSMKCGPAWSSLSVSVVEKENEITAVKDLLDPVYVKDRVWTADGMHTQETACQRIEQFGGKYLFFFKDNHPTAHEDLALFFEDPDADQSTWNVFSHTEKGHGRLTTRTVRTTTEMNEWFAGEWAGVAQTFQVIRSVKRKRTKLIEQTEQEEQTKPIKQAKQAKVAKQRKQVEETSQQVVYGFSNLTPAQ